MFDDGYDHFCFDVVSTFEASGKSNSEDTDIYCGCVSHLQQQTAAHSSDRMVDDVSQHN